MLKKLTNKKGFTLMEMLIVVAIIAILVAIAIPTFNSALNKSKVAADTANIRSGYAAVQVQILTEEGAAGTYGLNDDGTVVAITASTTAGDYTTKGKTTATTEIAGITVNAWDPGEGVTYTVTDGKVTTITVG